MLTEELLEDYVVRPREVARTLLMRGDESFATRAPTGHEPLFELSTSDENMILKWPLGMFVLTSREVNEATPDPLWESADGICSHMEKDHADTFGEFYRQRGWQGEVDSQTLMPWVEQRGFFLHNPHCLAWVPFPQECPTPNDVRKSMIKMLREIRHE